MDDDLSRYGVDEDQLSERYIRGTGPGGQNVNKVATTVQLRFDIGASTLPEPVKQRLRRLAGQRLNVKDELLIEARTHRTRERNREEARARLAQLLRAAQYAPRPRKPTRPSLGAKRRRLEGKKRRARVKAWRRPVRPDE